MRRFAAIGILGLAGSLALAQSAALPGRFPVYPTQPSGQRLPCAPVAPQASAAAPPPAAPVGGEAFLVENLKTFEPRDVKLTWHNRHWLLTHRGEALKDFGLREQEARHALRVIQDLRLNQYGTVGSPPVMEYWLCDGVAPQQQVRLGMRALPLDFARLRAEEVQGQWCLREGQRVLFSFGKKADDARQALAVMRKYHFDQVGMIGQPSPSMYVFLAPPPAGQALPAPRPSGGNTRQMNTPRFSRLAKNPDGTPRQDAKKAAEANALVLPSLPPVSKSAPPPQAQPPAGMRQAPPWREQPRIGTLDPQSRKERVTFDWRQVQLRQDGPDWKLVSGSLVLANFGANVHDARLALSAVRHFRFTEQHRMGGERPVLSYCAAPAQSPRGVPLGMPAQVLQPDKLEVRQQGQTFALCSGEQVVLRMGERPDEARRLMEVIKTNKFDRLCQFGEPGKDGLALLVRSR